MRLTVIYVRLVIKNKLSYKQYNIKYIKDLSEDNPRGINDGYNIKYLIINNILLNNN